MAFFLVHSFISFASVKLHW